MGFWESFKMITANENPINNVRYLALKSGLKMEIIGLKIAKGSRPTCYSMVKKEFGFKGNKTKVLEQLENWIEKNLM